MSMVVAKISRGRSFKGVTAYLTNPKRGETAERTSFVSVENVGTDDPALAARIMAATAMNADALKRAAGERVGAPRKHGDVLHLMMSWKDHPGEVTPEHQQAAARDLLKTLGLDRAQAIMAAHIDTENPHVHIAVNLVDPERGTLFKLDDDFRKMSAWASAYEKANGHQLTEAREKNAERRLQGEQGEPNKRLTRDQFESMDRTATAAARRDVLTSNRQAFTDQKTAHDAEWKATKSLAAHYRQRLREHTAQIGFIKKPERKAAWRTIFQRQSAEKAAITRQAQTATQQEVRARQGLERAVKRQRSFVFGRLLPALGIKTDPNRAAFVLEAAAATLATVRAAVTTMEVRHVAERKALAAQFRTSDEREAAATLGINAPDFDAMKARQTAERDALRRQSDAARTGVGLDAYQPNRRALLDEAKKAATEAKRKAAKAAASGDQKDHGKRKRRPRGFDIS